MQLGNNLMTIPLKVSLAYYVNCLAAACVLLAFNTQFGPNVGDTPQRWIGYVQHAALLHIRRASGIAQKCRRLIQPRLDLKNMRAWVKKMKEHKGQG